MGAASGYCECILQPKHQRHRWVCCEFLRATACIASYVLAIVEVSVRLSVRPSHPGTVSKRRHLESRNLHFGCPKTLVFSDKILCPWVMGFPSNEGVKLEYPLKRYFAIIVPSVWKWLQIGRDLLHIVTSTGDVLFRFVNIDDLERPWTPKWGVLLIFLQFLAAAHIKFKEACAGGRQRRLRPKNGYFTALAWKQLQMDADMLLIITSTGDVLLNGVNIDDLWPWMTLNSQKRGFSVFLQFSACYLRRCWVLRKLIRWDTATGEMRQNNDVLLNNFSFILYLFATSHGEEMYIFTCLCLLVIITAGDLFFTFNYPILCFDCFATSVSFMIDYRNPARREPQGARETFSPPNIFAGPSWEQIFEFFFFKTVHSGVAYFLFLSDGAPPQTLRGLG